MLYQDLYGLLNNEQCSNKKIGSCEEFGANYLTKREKEVIKYIIVGYTAKKIGKALCISHRTVECYVDKLKIKLHCDTKNELIEKIIMNGLIHALELI
jgi:DNA-binding NarL/FixJ family response regulator